MHGATIKIKIKIKGVLAVRSTLFFKYTRATGNRHKLAFIYMIVYTYFFHIFREQSLLPFIDTPKTTTFVNL
jgi:hypothetical protein